MTSARKPNRRPLDEIRRHASGELCPRNQKLRYITAKAARIAMGEVASHDPQSELLSVYQCGDCRDWHIGHDRKPSARSRRG